MQVKNGQANIYNGLNVSGSTVLIGTGNTSATTALTVQSNDTTTQFAIRNAGSVFVLGEVRLGSDDSYHSIYKSSYLNIKTLSSLSIGGSGASSALTLLTAGTSNGSIQQNSDGTITFSTSNSNTFGVQGGHIFQTSTQVPSYVMLVRNTYDVIGTSGDTVGLQVGLNFVPTSGTKTFTSILVTGSVNQTGGSSGTTRGLYIQPVLTSAASWRSIEWTNNTGWGLYGAGSGSNYLKGNLSIGTTATGSALTVSGSTALIGSGSTILSIDGSSGRLFSVDDSLSGSLFSVNTAAGLPVMEAFSDNTVRIGQYGTQALFVSKSAVGIGTETPTSTLTVSGSAAITGPTIMTGATALDTNYVLTTRNNLGTAVFRIADNGVVTVVNNVAFNLGYYSFTPSSNNLVIAGGHLGTTLKSRTSTMDSQYNTALYTIGSTTFNGTSGLPQALQVNATINNSGTAGYNGLTVSITETTTGSGDKSLLRLYTNGVQRFKVDNTGSVFISGSLTVTQGITGSLQGTAATASYYAGNAITSNGSTIYSISPSTTNFPSFGSICIGSNAGYNASSAFYLVALGEQAGYQANAAFSTFIGYQAGYNATDASDTVAIGYQAGYQGVKSQYSVLIGDLTGRGATSASYSTYVGANAGNNALYAFGSVFLGYNAGNGAASGSYSILLGYNAGWGNSFPNSSIGTNNIIIGNSITLAKDRRDSINIGGIIFGTGSYFSSNTNQMSSGSANGRIGINVSNPTATLEVSGSTYLSGSLIVTQNITVQGSGSLSIAAPTDLTATFDYSGTTYSVYNAEGWTFNYRVYSYIDSPTGKIFSSTYATLGADIMDDFSYNNYTIQLSWTAAPGVSGYRILVYTDYNFMPYSYDIGVDVLTNSYTDSGAYFNNTSVNGASDLPFTSSLNNVNINGTVNITGSINFNNGKLFTITGDNNIVIGENGKTFGVKDNFFVGTGSGYQATTVANSYFLGYNAGYQATNAYTSYFLGYDAGYQATNANRSNFIGSGAGIQATNAYHSNFIGLYAGYQASTSSTSNFIGYSAGYQATNAFGSNFIGYSAGSQTTNTFYSNFLGYNAGYQATNAHNSNFIGPSAGAQAASAPLSNFIGYDAGYIATNASNSNFLGQRAGGQATNADNSNFLGQNAGRNAVNASYSTLVGYNAGYATTNTLSISSSNIIIGTNITLAAGRANSINIGGIIFGTGAYSTTTGNPSSGSAGGRIGINVVEPTATLDITGSSTAQASLRLRSGTAPTSPQDGDIWFDGTNLKMRVGGVTKTFTMT